MNTTRHLKSCVAECEQEIRSKQDLAQKFLKRLVAGQRVIDGKRIIKVNLRCFYFFTHIF